MSEPWEASSARQQQFFVIGTVMVAALLHSFAMAGGFHAVEASRSEFRGGEFCYKFASGDYADSMSLIESIGNDMGLEQAGDGYADALYTLYLDEPMTLVNADRLRFAAGHLARTVDGKRINRDVLLKKNKAVSSLSLEDQKSLSSQASWPRLPYKTVRLANVKEGIVAHFPFTGGSASALLLTYKIMPSLIRQAKETGMKDPIVVLSTCSVWQRMCTHYAVSGKTFLLGQPDTAKYASMIPSTSQPSSWTRLIKIFV